MWTTYEWNGNIQHLFIYLNGVKLFRWSVSYDQRLQPQRRTERFQRRPSLELRCVQEKLNFRAESNFKEQVRGFRVRKHPANASRVKSWRKEWGTGLRSTANFLESRHSDRQQPAASGQQVPGIIIYEYISPTRYVILCHKRPSITN